MGRPRIHPKPQFPQVLIRDCAEWVINRRAFDAGNMHARWVKVNGHNRFEVRSYDTLIAYYEPERDNSTGVWTMKHYDEMSKTTRYHSNVTQRAIRQYLYQS